MPFAYWSEFREMLLDQLTAGTVLEPVKRRTEHHLTHSRSPPMPPRVDHPHIVTCR